MPRIEIPEIVIFLAIYQIIKIELQKYKSILLTYVRRSVKLGEIFSRVSTICYPYDFRNLSNEELLQIIFYGHDKLPHDSNAKIAT